MLHAHMLHASCTHAACTPFAWPWPASHAMHDIMTSYRPAYRYDIMITYRPADRHYKLPNWGAAPIILIKDASF